MPKFKSKKILIGCALALTMCCAPCIISENIRAGVLTILGGAPVPTHKVQCRIELQTNIDRASISQPKTIEELKSKVEVENQKDGVADSCSKYNFKLISIQQTEDNYKVIYEFDGELREANRTIY